ncbi:hypothetical protein JOC94_004340 [Bacillus thermophilus]|uniref:DUF2332 domain-containing protein n=1 Tax=Siminovitchia thermophila TaxID=1245522 RepID=A0ABS2REL7_9BACI|nr:DUF2332 domain-containing protein [Siminovitchia thermophila]MBM7717313.1 hypothetical protein [Siminovitchia thermophila]ONK22023.1 hypothetical protein BLX87_19195 [Bacillus sp. VT-16-64]
MDQSQLSVRFKNFADIECKGSSRLYELLSRKIAEDDEILELCSFAKVGQPVPNLLLGAVHYLLLKGRDHLLRDYYPSIVPDPKEIEGAFVHFKDFCQIYRDEIISLLTIKLVQTNEVRRCAYLYPTFCYVYNKIQKPLSLIEIGTSAGLQLLWNHYNYSYGNNVVYGNKLSNVHITSEVKGDNVPLLFKESPPVVSKLGIDLHISDLSNSEDYLWLKSLIWPEHKERKELFEKSAKCFNENPVELLEGDGVALLTEVVETLPKNTAICIFHTHVANQIPEDLKYDLLNKIKTIGSKRDVFHLYNNMWDRNLHLDYFIDGVEYNQTIGSTDGHGRWFEWNIE